MIRAITSPSNLHRRRLCPGSERMEMQMPPDVDSADATEGTMLHKALQHLFANETLAGFERLTDEQKWAVEFCHFEINKAVKEFFGDSPFSALPEVPLLWNGLETGHADYVFHCDEQKRLFIPDVKFGRNVVTRAESNDQLLWYAVMAGKQYDIEEVYCAPIQPRVEKHERCSYVRFSKVDLTNAEDQVRHIQWLNKLPNAALVPGLEQCRYCRARSVCPALVSQMDELTIVSPLAVNSENAAELKRKCQIIKQHVGALEEKIFWLVQVAEMDGRKIPNLSLKPGNKKRTITDAGKAFQTLTAAIPTITAEDFAKCCTAKISAIDSLFKDKSEMTAKEAKEALGKLLTEAGCMEVTQSQPSVELD